MKLDQPFSRTGLIEILSSNSQPRVAFPEILPVLMEMMQLGLQSVISGDELSSGVHGKSLQKSEVRLESPPASLTIRVTELTKQISLLDAVVGLFADLHQNSTDFRDFAAQSDYVQWLLYVTFPVVVGSDIPSTDFELKSRAAKPILMIILCLFDRVQVEQQDCAQQQLKGLAVVKDKLAHCDADHLSSSSRQIEPSSRLHLHVYTKLSYRSGLPLT